MTANTLFPDRPEYVGPTAGRFGLLAILAASVVFTVGQIYGFGQAREYTRAEVAKTIENAQLQVADAISEAHRFQASLECVAETIIAGCWRYEIRVRP